MKYCTASFVPLLTKRDARRECIRGIISQLDDTNDAKLAQCDGFNFVCKIHFSLEFLYYKIKTLSDAFYTFLKIVYLVYR